MAMSEAELLHADRMARGEAKLTKVNSIRSQTIRLERRGGFNNSFNTNVAILIIRETVVSDDPTMQWTLCKTIF